MQRSTGVPGASGVAGPNLTNVAYLQNLMAQIKVLADFTSVSDPAFTLGTTTNPRIVYINGDFTLSSSQCGSSTSAEAR